MVYLFQPADWFDRKRTIPHQGGTSCTDDMAYSVSLAQTYIGKRVIVSIRHVGPDGEETFSGLWGVIGSVHEGGLLLSVEGGIDEEFWMLPPDLSALIPATQASYHHEHCTEPVVDVDFEAYFSCAESPEDLE